MSSVQAMSGGGAPTGATSLTGGANVLGKDDFLTLLVAQLTHQDPLDPKEDTEFVAQLAQFSSLEQLMGIGDGMNTLAMTQAASNSADTVGFIGKEVMAVGNEVRLGDSGGATLGWNLAAPAASVTVEIVNAQGVTVRTLEIEGQAAGNHRFEWDGLDEDGLRQARGPYTFEVVAKGGDGGPIPADPLVLGRVTGVTFERGYPQLVLGATKVLLANVREVSE